VAVLRRPISAIEALPGANGFDVQSSTVTRVPLAGAASQAIRSSIVHGGGWSRCGGNSRSSRRSRVFTRCSATLPWPPASPRAKRQPALAGSVSSVRRYRSTSSSPTTRQSPSISASCARRSRVPGTRAWLVAWMTTGRSSIRSAPSMRTPCGGRVPIRRTRSPRLTCGASSRN